jgi:hypothetical protein
LLSRILLPGASCIVLGLAAPGCGSWDEPEGAVELSESAFETAQRQGVDMKEAPCIYYPNTPSDENTWFAVVVWPGDASPRAAARAAGCPGADTLGYVALDQFGEVIEVRDVPASER